ncbi:deoxyribose-phosphate aldolase [Parenemella sanctibonifatiensis]|uniref:Deoxyribose-phosphate aldolase n=2 Tax=Parenemella sanctibonifatiensis TaxID=2016505 RepID=A0A255EQ53_9ACTN|nr:deoxyribose-phosphate aldolase [Parenemella sanctibonifatiensis]
MNAPSRAEVAQIIDHTLLKPEATREQVRAAVAEAAELGAYAVCVSPSMLPLELPEGLRLAVVCGFPSGAHQLQVKSAEAKRAAEQGAREIDMVLNLANVLAGDADAVYADIRAVRDAAPGVLLKVIIESAALTDEQIVMACEQAVRADADYVKTSTGMHPAGGASVHAVELMAATVGGRLGVKASGGIRDAETALAMIQAGATRLGLSGTAAVLAGI